MSLLKEKHILYSLITFLILLVVTLVVMGWSMGYRFNWREKSLNSTGMIAFNSLPVGAKVSLDEEVASVTNGSVSGIVPGKHHIQLIKDGYTPWEKDIEVFPQLVTEVNALLIPISSRIEPLISGGARYPVLSPSRGRLVYFTQNGKYPGIWGLSLTGQPFLNIFKTSASPLIKDIPTVKFSNGEELIWSPQEDELLVKMNDSGYFLIDLRSSDYQATSSSEPTIARWEETLLKKRAAFVENLKIPEYLIPMASDSDTLWSPNEQRFLYVKQDDDYIEYRVANFEQPLAVGGQQEYVSLRLHKDTDLAVNWYSDSNHLILVSYDEVGQTGTIELIEIDGSNRSEVYSGNMSSSAVYSNPSGDRLIFLASFKNNTVPDLYTISLR